MTLEEFNKKYPSITERVKHMDEDVKLEDFTLDDTINISNNKAVEYARLMQGRKGYEKEIHRHIAVYHRHIAVWLEELKRDREILNGLGIYFQSLVVDAVINQRPLMFDMRDATEEERESVKRYIADSTSTTGVNFWSLIGEVNADADSD